MLVTLLIPAAYLLASSFHLPRPRIYIVWVGLFALFLVAELLLDYVFAVPFRHVRWQLIAYVVLFFGSFGGLIGLASLQGRAWGVAAIVGFLSTAILAFLQHRATGL